MFYSLFPPSIAEIDRFFAEIIHFFKHLCGFSLLNGLGRRLWKSFILSQKLSSYESFFFFSVKMRGIRYKLTHFGWKSVMILYFLHLLFNLNMFGSSCVWQNGCIGRESNPGRPRSAFISLAGEHSTTEPPMLVVNDVLILVVITLEWAVVVWKGKSQWMKIMVEWIKNVPPMRGIEPRPRRWKRRILTTRPHGMTDWTFFPFPCFFSFPFSWAKKIKVPPRFELGLQDSESWVLTITPWDLDASLGRKLNLNHSFLSHPSRNSKSVWLELSSWQ